MTQAELNRIADHIDEAVKAVPDAPEDVPVRAMLASWEQILRTWIKVDE